MALEQASQGSLALFEMHPSSRKRIENRFILLWSLLINYILLLGVLLLPFQHGCFSGNGNHPGPPEENPEHLLLRVLSAGSKKPLTEVARWLRCRRHYASGHYRDLLLQRGTEKATDSRDDFYTKDHIIVLEKLRKRTDWQYTDLEPWAKLHQKRRLCIELHKVINFEFICTVPHSA